MAFDVYSGSFTRFYTRNWENIAQRQARLDGTEYKMIYAGGDPGPPPPAQEIRDLVNEWRSAINEALAPHGLKELDWSEADDTEYFTDRPGWDGYAGLLLWAAYAERPNEEPPLELPESWADDRVYQSVMEDEQRIHFVTILLASLWLPGDFDFCFKFPGLTDEELMIGSCRGLRDQLHELEGKPLKWQQPDSLQNSRNDSVLTFEEAAKAGRACFYALAEKAAQNRLPLVLSF